MTNTRTSKHIRVEILLALCAAFQSPVFTPAARADSRTQTVTFDAWVEIPASS
jgi:hypothetical protein